MGQYYRLDISALRASTVDIKYWAWSINHPHLFGPHPSAYMPSAVVIDITVHASRVEDNDVDIPAVPYEAGLQRSLISVEYARATQGRIVPTEAVLSLQDAAGRTYRSSSYITLIWWIYGETISNREDFYITEDLPQGRNAMLRRTSDDGKPKRKALPLFNRAQTAEEKKNAEDRRKLEDKLHSATRQAENQKMVDKIKKLTSSSTKQPSQHARTTRT